MANNLLTYSGIITKIKAMSSNLFQKEDYRYLTTIETIPEFVNFLKKSPSYYSLFADLDENQLSRHKIEATMVHTLYSDFNKIYAFASQTQRQILSFLFLRYEVDLLKSCLRSVLNKKDAANAVSHSKHIGKHSKLDIDALINCRSVEDILLVAKNTDYYNNLHIIYNDESSTLFDYEMQLDIYYYKKIWKQKDKYLKSSLLKSFTHIYGTTIDLLNITWIYRFKKYYNMDAIKIYSYVIPVNYRLSRTGLSELIEAPSISEFIELIKKSSYADIYGDFGDSSFEMKHKQLLVQLYKTASQKHTSSMAPILYYLFLKEFEIDLLTSTLECIRYKLKPDEVEKYITLI